MKKLKAVLCTILAIAMMVAVLVIPASAADARAVSLNYDWQFLAVGEKEDIYATVTNPNNVGIKGVYWTVGKSNQNIQLIGTALEIVSSNPSVTPQGQYKATIQGDRNGADYVTVWVEFVDGYKVSDSELLTISPRVYPASVATSPKNVDAYAGDRFTLSADVKAANFWETPTDKSVTWTSSEPGIVSVNKDTGEVRAISPGTAVITATAKDHQPGQAAPSGSTTIRVSNRDKNGNLFTGFVKEADGWYWYDAGVKNATSKAPYTGAIYGNVNGTEGWWRTVNGKADTAYTGLTYFKAKPGQNGGGWWYFENGYITGKWTGFVTNAAGTWYVKNSQVNFKETGVVYNPKDGNWYFVKNSKLTPGPDVEPNAAGWWYIDNTGKVDFNKTSVEHNKAGWWRIENGKVNFNFNGLASNAAGTWVIKGGKVNFNYNGKYNYKGQTYNIRNGKVV